MILRMQKTTNHIGTALRALEVTKCCHSYLSLKTADEAISKLQVQKI